MKNNKDSTKPIRKPEWLKIKLPSSLNYAATEQRLRDGAVHTVCQAALCPNRGECYARGTASFLILGTECTRNCRFCNISTGKPLPPDPTEPERLAQTIHRLGLRYVVLTSVTRDDLKEGGAAHFARCVQAIKQLDATVSVELLTPDFRYCRSQALAHLQNVPIAVFNHNIETVPRLYPHVRGGADFNESLTLLKLYDEQNPTCPTKSGLMLGLGETDQEIKMVLEQLREHNCRMLTLGQYLQPSRTHWPVKRYVEPAEFDAWRDFALKLGFVHVASGPLVRSSYQAEQGEQALQRADKNNIIC